MINVKISMVGFVTGNDLEKTFQILFEVYTGGYFFNFVVVRTLKT